MTITHINKGGINKVSSNQSDIHDKLEAVVNKHRQTLFKKPVADHTRQAFDAIATIVDINKQPLILDSGCGTALSTRHIAEAFPDHQVIGIDRSFTRLHKEYNTYLPENALLVQADLVDLWRLVREAGWQIARHYLLFPNPYPKSVHLKRRWHAHPVFPDLLALGGMLELRTNWYVYAKEFASALGLYGYQAEALEYQVEKPWTLFEKKYAEDGQVLYRCQINLS
jgi:tRNA (guanine-N7-)-methyltransferase